MDANSKFVFRCLSVFSLVLILPFPTEFYFFSRAIIFIGAIYGAIEVKKLNSSEGESLFLFLCVIAFVFNPIIMIFLYSKALWAVLNILAAYAFFKAASLIDNMQMEKLSAQTNNISESLNTKTTKIQDENQKKENDELQKKSLTNKTGKGSNENKITDEDIENFKSLNHSVYILKTNEDTGKAEFIPNFDFLPEETQKKIDVLKETNPNLFNEIFGAEAQDARNRARERERENEKNPTRLDIALRYFQTCIELHIERGGKAEFFYMVGVRKYQMEKFKDIDISFWQYTRIEAEANSFIKYHLNQNKKDELIRVSRLYVTSKDPKLEEIRGYLDKII